MTDTEWPLNATLAVRYTLKHYGLMIKTHLLTYRVNAFNGTYNCLRSWPASLLLWYSSRFFPVSKV